MSTTPILTFPLRRKETDFVLPEGKSWRLTAGGRLPAIDGRRLTTGVPYLVPLRAFSSSSRALSTSFSSFFWRAQ